METTLSRIWILFTMSISKDNKHYITNASYEAEKLI